jgi:hypothetical protein
MDFRLDLDFEEHTEGLEKVCSAPNKLLVVVPHIMTSVCQSYILASLTASEK